MHLAAVQIQRAWRPSWRRRAAARRVRLGGATSVVPAGESGGNDTQSLRVSRRGRRADTVYEISQAERAWRQALAHDELKRRHLRLLQAQFGTTSSQRRPVDVNRPGPTFQDFCASLIQNAWRMHHTNLHGLVHVLKHRGLVLHNVAAFEIQRAWREYSDAIEQAKEMARSTNTVRAREEWQHDSVTGSSQSLHGLGNTKEEEAARKLQRFWRQWEDKKTYRSLRSIVLAFRRSGDPCLVLRSILPRESLLFDPSMQIHVRFRLGGVRFPPLVYFKVFTHAPVCDVGAFAPRNYFAHAILREGKGRVQELDKMYEREDNNGWRPLVARAKLPGQELMKQGPVRATKAFHHSRMRRRQDLERQRKQRTIAWMRKLYGLAACTGVVHTVAAAEQPEPEPPAEDQKPDDIGDGVQHSVPEMLSPHPPPASAQKPGRPRPKFLRTTTFASVSSANSNETIDNRRERPGKTAPLTAEVGYRDEVDDDTLLEWSKRLDFDAYMESWQQLGTSDLSEAGLPLVSLQKQSQSALWSAGAMTSFLPNGKRSWLQGPPDITESSFATTPTALAEV